jgi:hypothetical protein
MNTAQEAMNARSELAMASAILQQARAELAAGNDIAPAKLFAMEALLTQAIAAGVTSTEIKAAIEKLLPEDGTLNIAERNQCLEVTLQLWQQRAPVVPST